MATLCVKMAPGYGASEGRQCWRPLLQVTLCLRCRAACLPGSDQNYNPKKQIKYRMNKSKSQPCKIKVLGIPFDENSSYRRGTALAPPRIREAFFSESANLWTENLTDLGSREGWDMAGDLDFQTGQNSYAQIEPAISKMLVNGSRVVALGGDHSITYPIVRAHRQKYDKLNILHFDAHPDLYNELDGNRFSHACPFARILEEKLAARVVQVGIRTLNGHQAGQAQRFGVEIMPMQELRRAKEIAFAGPVYLSLDLDCLDPAFAPGVSHYEPGGMSTRAVLDILQSFKGQLIGADIVEYNPEKDVNGLTAMVAAKFLKEILARMLAN